MKVSKGQKITCPHCGVVLAECPKDFELKETHSFEGTIVRLGFTYNTIDWLSNSAIVECMECGEQFNAYKHINGVLGI